MRKRIVGLRLGYFWDLKQFKKQLDASLPAVYCYIRPKLRRIKEQEITDVDIISIEDIKS